MADKFSKYRIALKSPADNAVAVTPSDSTDLDNVSRGIWVGGAGDISLITKGGTTLTFVGAVAGTTIPIRASRIRATGTTATGLVAIGG